MSVSEICGTCWFHPPSWFTGSVWHTGQTNVTGAVESQFTGTGVSFRNAALHYFLEVFIWEENGRSVVVQLTKVLHSCQEVLLGSQYGWRLHLSAAVKVSWYSYSPHTMHRGSSQFPGDDILLPEKTMWSIKVYVGTCDMKKTFHIFINIIFSLVLLKAELQTGDC